MKEDPLSGRKKNTGFRLRIFSCHFCRSVSVFLLTPFLFFSNSIYFVHSSLRLLHAVPKQTTNRQVNKNLSLRNKKEKVTNPLLVGEKKTLYFSTENTFIFIDDQRCCFGHLHKMHARMINKQIIWRRNASSMLPLLFVTKNQYENLKLQKIQSFNSVKPF